MAPTVNRIAASLPLHEWASLRTELIWIYDREVDPKYLQGRGSSMPGHRAWLIRHGTVSITGGARLYAAKAGMWVMPPQGPVDISFSKNAHILSIHFVCHWPSGENILTNNQVLCFKAETYPALDRMAKKMELTLRKQFPERGQREQIYNHQSSDYGSFLHLQGLFFNWLAAWFEIQMRNGAKLTRLTSGDSRPFQAARCLDQAPLNGGFPVARLQQETGLGLMRLNQLFYAEFATTTRKYWDRRRLGVRQAMP